MKRPDGTTATVLRYMFPVVEDNGEINLVIGYGLNIADRKALEEKQAILVKQLSLQNTQLVDFCNIVSHNLRAPLVNMTMLVDFMKESTDPEELQLFIAKLDPVIKNLHTTFNELVESIRVKQDIEVEAETMNLQDVLERTLDSLGTEMNSQSVTISHDFDEAPDIYFPPKYLHSIFHNFLSNASKYRSPQRGLIINIKSSKVNNNIILQFADNGMGIDLVKHGQKLFKIGKVFHQHTDAKGFGLYMTKTQVEAMGGRIWVESVPDEGSTFYIEFTKQG
ncbi:sensor histidine kinase [Mucilaginibacter ginsenosidivorax]|uniref:histidine kinase n=1 Tax=Mucilaginibacter ginsenosidivorax TaxID=862126 RepID=A0A5B8VZK4_9SPHI|nr:HAMP domain-containing sensor histidine kinase [Mucilaginibacter ginsenosidivorax]QEC76954.1 HAMP domain-containing histidine kinase [Mucilaginibacter ginsenosidivorax]